MAVITTHTTSSISIGLDVSPTIVTTPHTVVTETMIGNTGADTSIPTTPSSWYVSPSVFYISHYTEVTQVQLFDTRAEQHIHPTSIP